MSLLPLLSVLKRRVLHLGVAVSLCFGMGVPVVRAADIHISAAFMPDINNPNQREFVNTTPWSGVCLTHLNSCIRNNWWSIDTRIRGTKLGNGKAGYGRGSFFIGMPAPRRVMVASVDGADSFPLDLKIIGSALRITDEERDGTVNPASLGGPSAGCRTALSNGSANNYSAMRMFIRNDGGEGTHHCALDWLRTNNYAIKEFDLTYSLSTPNPLGMKSGVYSGSTTFTVGGTGEGGDFDLGDGVTLDDNSVTVHFTLTIQHAFQLDLAPGSDRAILMPKGGWTQWSDHGIVPKALEKTLPFHLSSSGRFSVSLACEHALPDGRCAIRNRTEAADDVPLDVQLTMPGFRNVDSGVDAVHVPLTSGMTPPVFSADTFVIRRPSQLHFAVNGDAVRDMLSHPGSHYRGDVTVIFDADP
jgi:hypothetical protein